MTIKKYGILSMLFFGLVSVISAQHHRGILEHSKDLELTKEQEDAIWEIQYENRRAIKSKRTEIMKSGRVDLKTKAVAFQSAIDTILTEDQRMKWREIQAFNTEDRRVTKEELKEDLGDFREKRQSYIDEKIKPAIQKHRVGFDQILTESERSSIEAAREKRMVAKSEPPNKGNQNRLKENHKSVARILFDHKDELDRIWSELEGELAVWNDDLKGMNPNFGGDSTKNRKHHAKNRKGQGEKVGFSHLDFILIDY